MPSAVGSVPIYHVLYSIDLTACLLDFCHPDDLPALRLSSRYFDDAFKASPHSIARKMLRNNSPIVVLFPVRPEDEMKPRYLRVLWSLAELRIELHSAMLILWGALQSVGFFVNPDELEPPEFRLDGKYPLEKLNFVLWDALLYNLLDRAAAVAKDQDRAEIQAQQKEISSEARKWYPDEFASGQTDFTYWVLFICSLYHFPEGHHFPEEYHECSECDRVSLRIPSTEAGSPDVVIRDVYRDIELKKGEIIVRHLEYRILAQAIMLKRVFDGIPRGFNTNVKRLYENPSCPVMRAPFEEEWEELKECWEGGYLPESNLLSRIDKYWDQVQFAKWMKDHKTNATDSVDQITRFVRRRVEEILDERLPIWRMCAVHTTTPWDLELRNEAKLRREAAAAAQELGQLDVGIQGV
ncbi:hypothetical protein TWF281_009038 [Arthrobotrys megalospora]